MELQFPVAILFQDPEEPDCEGYTFCSEEAFNVVSAAAPRYRRGALILDRAEQAYRTDEVRLVQPTTPLWLRILMTILRQRDEIKFRAVYDLSAAELTFAELQDRIVAAVERDREMWADDEYFVHGRTEPLDLDELIGKAVAAVRAATTVADIGSGLRASWPY